jgi:hypothetical protein
MYQFPEIPKRETLDINVSPIRADDRQTGGYAAPSHSTIKNTTPDPVTDGAYQLPGTQLFAIANQWLEAPTPVDIIHREISQPVLDSHLVYRSGLQAPRRDSPNYRIFAPSITSNPGLNSATFNGDRGDIYGS